MASSCFDINQSVIIIIVAKVVWQRIWAHKVNNCFLNRSQGEGAGGMEKAIS